MILDYVVDFEVPILLGKLCIIISRALVDLKKGSIKFRLKNEEATFKVFMSMRQSSELLSVSQISYRLRVLLRYKKKSTFVLRH